MAPPCNKTPWATLPWRTDWYLSWRSQTQSCLHCLVTRQPDFSFWCADVTATCSVLKNSPVFLFPRGASGLLCVHLKELEDPKFSSSTATDPLVYTGPMPCWKPRVANWPTLGLSSWCSFMLPRISSFTDWPEWLAASCLYVSHFSFLPQAKPTHASGHHEFHVPWPFAHSALNSCIHICLPHRRAKRLRWGTQAHPCFRL